MMMSMLFETSASSHALLLFLELYIGCYLGLKKTKKGKDEGKKLLKEGIFCSKILIIYGFQSDPLFSTFTYSLYSFAKYRSTHYYNSLDKSLDTITATTPTTLDFYYFVLCASFPFLCDL